jgi:ATP-dependent protease ClpP protease subunit
MDTIVTPVATITMTRAISAAAVIFMMGSKNLKYMGPNAYLMVHEASTSSDLSKQCDAKALNDHIQRLDKSFNTRICQHLDLPPKFFDNLGHVDTYFSAKDALKNHLCDHIGFPTLSITFDCNMDIDLRKLPKRKELDPDKRPYKYQKFLSETIKNYQDIPSDED